jgi:hypothetical protein
MTCPSQSSRLDDYNDKYYGDYDLMMAVDDDDDE